MARFPTWTSRSWTAPLEGVQGEALSERRTEPVACQGSVVHGQLVSSEWPRSSLKVPSCQDRSASSYCCDVDEIGVAVGECIIALVDLLFEPRSGPGTKAAANVQMLWDATLSSVIRPVARGRDLRQLILAQTAANPHNYDHRDVKAAQLRHSPER